MIHASAVIDEGAKIGSNVSIGPYSVVHKNIVIGDNTEIGAYCELGLPTKLANGRPLIIGKGAVIRSHSVFYEGSTIGENLVTGHRVTIRELTTAGDGFQIGTLGDIQGHCEIGDYVKCHSNVHIGQHSTVGNYVWIFPYVVLTNDPHPPSEVMAGVTIEDFAVIATMSVILPGVTVKKGALIAAHSSVNKDVNPDTLVAGSPSKLICGTEMIKLKDGSGNQAYPWRRHFHRGYPEKAVAEWIKEFS